MEQEKQGKTPDAFEAQMEVLRFLSESTDDYLFSWEFPEDRIYFAGPVWKRYAIMDPGQSSCPCRTGAAWSMKRICLPCGKNLS